MLPVLVIETATAACSVALLAGGRSVAAVHEIVGRGHAERLVPMIAELPGGGHAGRVLVDCGPGSFTGIRVGLAAARAFGLAWQSEVTGFSSLALIAAVAFHRHPALAALAVVLEGGHGEVFMQVFTPSPLAAQTPLQSLPPAAAATALGELPAFGNGVRHLIAAGIPASRTTDLLPCAADVLRLPASATILPPQPIYGRMPDARLP